MPAIPFFVGFEDEKKVLRGENLFRLREIQRLLNAWMESGIQSLRRISALLKRAGARYLDSMDISPWSFNNGR